MDISLRLSHGLGEGILILVQPTLGDPDHVEAVIESGPETARIVEALIFDSKEAALAYCRTVIEDAKAACPDTLIVLDIWPELPLP